MKRYETIFISDPDLPQQDLDQLFEKTKDLIEKQAGFIVKFDDWGNKKLAYEIKKKSRGYYVRIDYCGDGPLVDEMERSFRIDDRVLKYMTICLSRKDIDLEKLKAQLAEEKAEMEKEMAAAETETQESAPESAETDTPSETEKEE